jgi:hypothetical protein
MKNFCKRLILTYSILIYVNIKVDYFNYLWLIIFLVDFSSSSNDSKPTIDIYFFSYYNLSLKKFY